MVAWTRAVLLTHRPQATPLPTLPGTQPAPRAPWTGPGWSSVGVLRPVLPPSSQSGQLYSAQGLLPSLPSVQGPLDPGQEAQGGVRERCTRARPGHFHPGPASCAPARTTSQWPCRPPPQRLPSRALELAPWQQPVPRNTGARLHRGLLAWVACQRCVRDPASGRSRTTRTLLLSLPLWLPQQPSP